MKLFRDFLIHQKFEDLFNSNCATQITMLDIVRVFRVLHWLSEDQNHFLVAQDAYIICCSILDQFTNLGAVIEEYVEKLQGLDVEGAEHAMLLEVVEKLRDMSSRLDVWTPIITSLCDQASLFWFPATIDLDKRTPAHNEASQKWRMYAPNAKKGVAGQALPASVLEKVEAFRQSCKEIVESNFQELLQELRDEEGREDRQMEAMANNYLCHGSSIPTSLLRNIESSVKLLTVITDFPLTHFLLPATHFATLLGFSRARMIAIPFMRFIVNTAETNFVVANSVKGTVNRPATVIYYRCADGEITCVHWEIGENSFDGHFVGFGMDITLEMENARSSQGANMQRILRQWLHSIRNASFQQQAQLVEEDVQKLEAKLGAQGTAFQSDFNNILSGLKTLIYTTKASVGLIDQALYSKGLMSCTCVGDFVSAVVNFAPNFALSEKIDDSKLVCNVFLNHAPAAAEDMRSLFVGSDMLLLQSMVDNIYSNAIRYTDPELGVKVDVKVVNSSTLVQFLLSITDFGSEGLPSTVVRFLQENIDYQKVIDRRTRHKRKALAHGGDDPASTSTSSSRHRSSLTGIPHIVQLYHELTGSGQHDLDLMITVTDTGTTFTLHFALALLAPPSSIFEEPAVASETESLRRHFQSCTKKFLVVDDSAVVRRLLVRLFEKLEVPCHACEDGQEASNWFDAHHAECCGVVTDLEMPRMGGEGLILHVKQQRPDMPCVVVSGNEAISYSVPKGALRALMKPIVINDLQEILVDMLGLQGEDKSRSGDLGSFPISPPGSFLLKQKSM